MKKYILSALLFAAIGSFSCNNPDNKTINNTDSVRGNTDSAGSQPVHPVPAAANEGHSTDTIVPLRTDSVIKH